MKQPPKYLPWFMLCLTVFGWGSAYPAIRLGVETLPPALLGCTRYIISFSLISLLFIFKVKEKRAHKSLKDLLCALLVGIIGIGFYNIFLNTGEQHAPAAVAGFIIGTVPVLIACLSFIFLKKKLSKMGTLGLIICVLGMALIFIARPENFGAHDMHMAFLFLTLAALCGAVFSLLQSVWVKKMHPIEATFYLFLGGLITMSYSLFQHPIDHIAHASLTSILAMVYLGVIGTLSYTGWAYTLKYIPIQKASGGLYLVPVVTLLLGWWILGETPANLELLGGLCSIIGAIFIQRF